MIIGLDGARSTQGPGNRQSENSALDRTGVECVTSQHASECDSNDKASTRKYELKTNATGSNAVDVTNSTRLGADLGKKVSVYCAESKYSVSCSNSSPGKVAKINVVTAKKDLRDLPSTELWSKKIAVHKLRSARKPPDKGWRRTSLLVTVM